jgi:predicted TPR repeat methyltransferase
VRLSGNMIADRRYDYAQRAAAEGDYSVAADLLLQTLEIAPDWAAAWFALGVAREETGDLPGAIEAFERTCALDYEGGFGAGLHLARLGARLAPDIPPPAYIRGLFDQYADRFEKHLLEELDYRGPKILVAAIGRASLIVSRPNNFGSALDLGCGTGLMARELSAICDAIDGVDIAPAMVTRAKATGLYRRIEAGDLCPFLESVPAASVDLVTAADVFVYIGDLEPVMARARRVLRKDALFAFTVQVADNGDYSLGVDLRYRHSRVYLERLAEAYGLAVAASDDASIRQDRGLAVPGLALVLAAP